MLAIRPPGKSSGGSHGQCAGRRKTSVTGDARAVAQVPDAFLVIAGDGPLRGQVDRLAADLLPGRFLRKTFSHELMPMLYRSSNVLLHMATQEPFGNVYIEALASGTPIVAHDDENTRWILEDHALSG